MAEHSSRWLDSEPLTPDSLTRKSTQLALSIWEDARGDSKVPPMRALHPANFKPLLSQITVLDVKNDPWDFRFRIVGEKVREHHGFKASGRWISEIHEWNEQWRNGAIHFYACVAETCRPKAGHGTLAYLDRGYLQFESIALPYADPGAPVEKLLMAMDFYNADVDDEATGLSVSSAD